MADILAFPTPAPKDGGKARIRARRLRLFGLTAFDAAHVDDLTQHHADPEDTAPAEYSAPAFDGA